MNLSSIKKTSDEPLPRRILLYGTHGIGKSTWASRAPNPVFIQTEDGLRDIDTNAFPLATSLADVHEALRELYQQEHDFKTVAVDTADWLEKLVWKHVCQEGGKDSIEAFGYGKGYVMAAEALRSLLAGFDVLREKVGMQVILLAHCKVEDFKPPDTDSYKRYTPKLHKESAAILQEWCDEVLFANYKTYTRTEGKGTNERKIGTGTDERVLYTTARPSHLAKNRLQLPEEIPFVYGEFEALVKTAHQRRDAECPW